MNSANYDISPTEETLESAIRRATTFLRRAQLSHGEFKTLLGTDVRLSNAVFDSSPFVTSFVVYALSHVDCAEVDDMVQKALGFLRTDMEYGGLWRYYSSRQFKHCRIPPDLDDTACVSYALKSHGQAIPDNEWLFHHNRDAAGRFLTWVRPRRFAWAPRFWLVRALGALQARRARLRAPQLNSPDPRFAKRRDPVGIDVDPVVNANAVLYLGEGSDTALAIDYLISLLRAGPGDRFSLYYKDILALYYAVARAHLHSSPRLAAAQTPVLRDLLSRQHPDGSFGNPLSTALATSALLTYAPQAYAVPRAIANLLGSQSSDGSWEANAFYSGQTEFWGSQELTTALCTEALARCRAAIKQKPAGTNCGANLSPGTLARHRIAFIYGARETQWTGVGMSLLAETGVIRDTLRRCEPLIAERLGWSLESVLSSGRAFDEHELEPVITSIQLALTEGWRERGVIPDAVTARSGGEFTAGYLHGSLTFEDAVEMACRVSRCIREDRGLGQMFAVQVPLTELDQLQRRCPVNFGLVADNPKDVTIIACEVENAKFMEAFLKEEKIEYEFLPSKIGPHTPLARDWKPYIVQSLSGGPYLAPQVQYYSPATGGMLDSISNPAYMWRMISTPALTGRALQSMIDDGFEIFVEIGGRPIFAEMIGEKAAAAGKKAHIFSTMRQGAAVCPVMDETQAALRQLGVPTRHWTTIFELRARSTSGASADCRVLSK